MSTAVGRIYDLTAVPFLSLWSAPKDKGTGQWQGSKLAERGDVESNGGRACLLKEWGGGKITVPLKHEEVVASSYLQPHRCLLPLAMLLMLLLPPLPS